VVELFKNGLPGRPPSSRCWRSPSAVILGIPLGYFAARRHGTALDSLTVGASLLGVTIPVFFLPTCSSWCSPIGIGPAGLPRRLPDGGPAEPRHRRHRTCTDFYVLDGILTAGVGRRVGRARAPRAAGRRASGTIPLAIIVRITRAAVLDVTGEDYVRTAEAKGLLQSTIRRRHVLRNALLPVVTDGRAAGRPAAVRGRAHRDGVRDQRPGSDAVRAITAARLPVLQGFILAIALMYALINLLVDVLYGVIDPRVRVSVTLHRTRLGERRRRPVRGTDRRRRRARHQPVAGASTAASATRSPSRRAHHAGLRRGRGVRAAARAVRAGGAPVGQPGHAVDVPAGPSTTTCWADAFGSDLFTQLCLRRPKSLSSASCPPALGLSVGR
jgi:hypothetical protein